MSKFNPKVSIIIPVYNGSRYLGEAIDSALAQTYKNLEIIVVNDGSDDNGATDRVARSYKDKIRYFNKKENGGASTALNIGIAKMTGQYFSWLSHDDLYYPDKIKKQVRALGELENKNTIIMSDLDGVNEKNEKIYQTKYYEHIKAYPARVDSYIHPVIYNQTHGCTLLIPKVCFETEGLFDVGERVAQDFEMFYRIFLKYPHKLVPEVLVTARDTSNRMGRRAKPRASEEYSRLYIKIISNLSDYDISLLAKDKLELLSDLRFFFESAGYLPALEFVVKEIKNHTDSLSVDIVDRYLNQDENFSDIEEQIHRIIDQLGLVHKDNEKANKIVDLSIQKILEKKLSKKLKNISPKKLLNLVKVYESLDKSGLRRAEAYYISELVNSFVAKNNHTLLKRTVQKYLVGDDVSLGKKDLQVFFKKNKEKKRIMFCSTHWLTGGMERVMSNLFMELKEHYDLYLITPYDGRVGKISLPEEVAHIKMSNYNFYNKYEETVYAYAKTLKIDVLVGFYNLYKKQLELYNLCKDDPDIRTVASNHEYYFYPYENTLFLDIIEDRLEAFKSVDAVLWPTSMSAAIYDISGGNSYLMPNPNTYGVIKGGRLTNKNKNIICVGRFNDYIKRIDRILGCFQLIQDKLPESNLIIVGHCDRDLAIEGLGGVTINDMIKGFNLDENHIVFTGDVENVGEYYSQASVLLLASNSEGFGMVINEAASHGVPTVYNYIPGLEDLITDGENGFVVAQDDLVTMSERVCDILADDKLAKKLSSKAQEMVQRFDIKLVGEKWQHLIDSLLEENNKIALRKKLNKKIGYKIENQGNLLRITFNAVNKVAKNYKISLSTLCLGDTHVNQENGDIYRIKAESLLNSHSWRITKPFRKIKDILMDIWKGKFIFKVRTKLINTLQKIIEKLSRS